jgi:hypothetical protein
MEPLFERLPWMVLAQSAWLHAQRTGVAHTLSALHIMRIVSRYKAYNPTLEELLELKAWMHTPCFTAPPKRRELTLLGIN